VVGFPNLYFYDDHYYRSGQSGWEVSLRHDSGFALAAQSEVPPGLQKAKPGKAKRAGPPGPAKRRD
jgi:hypothetical protein